MTHKTLLLSEGVGRLIAFAAEEDCWLWLGNKGSGLYGIVQRRGRPWMAHRFVYTLICGEIPAGLQVQHICNNPPCCNPGHLRLGTPKENSQYMVDCGRDSGSKRCGEKHPRAVVTEAQALEILCSSESAGILATRLNLNFNTVWNIKKGRRWGHLKEKLNGEVSRIEVERE